MAALNPFPNADEIKMGLHCCADNSSSDICMEKCPYYNKDTGEFSCLELLINDLSAYIAHLESLVSEVK